MGRGSTAGPEGRVKPEAELARILEIVDRDPRYAPRAYEFTRRAVTYASEVVFATGTHVSGPELLEAIRRFARERYGVLAPDVLGSWGVRSTEDFGEIVFHLVDAGLLSKTEEDSRDDFRDVYAFEDAFGAAGYLEEVLGSSG
jgi:uncharacterized repeat protein (TIGR04138 family)